jgi:hypothetical protein
MLGFLAIYLAKLVRKAMTRILSRMFARSMRYAHLVFLLSHGQMKFVPMVCSGSIANLICVLG